MTPVKVVASGEKWKVVTASMENPIGPRLWGAEPSNGLPPVMDLFDSKEDALDCARIWNAYAAWTQQRSGKKKQWSKR